LLNKGRFSFTLDRAFGEVIRGCAAVRGANHPGTWIVPEMISAYERLHGVGLAHSVEAWCGDQLAGGLYGVSLGRTYFGESMFTRVSNASKAALVVLVQHLQKAGYELIDCQVTTPHLKQFGAREIPRAQFLRVLHRSLRHRTLQGRWAFIPEGGIRLA
jgi:leucyl/phenylalanyl-tRNA--protein transferase